jgi:hypothetical protein
MALESALWKRCLTGAKAVRHQGHKLDMQRIENCATSGHPDIEGCLDGGQFWIELKSCMRPVRSDTPIRPKTRISQGIWHEKRAKAGCRIAWILIQVGEANDARLYLVPGNRYDDITVPEQQLAEMSVLSPSATCGDVILRAVQGW